MSSAARQGKGAGPFGRVVGAFVAVERGAVLAEKGAVCLLLLGMTALAFGEVILRNFYDTGLPWAGIYLRQAVLWVALIGASLAASQNRHIKLDVLLKILPKKTVPSLSMPSARN